MLFLTHQVLAGLVAGCVYASLALALTMIYQSTHHLNFAQGEMAMFSTFLAWMLIQAGVPYWVAFMLTAVGSFLMGCAVEVVVMRPLRSAPLLSLVVVSIGLFVTFHSVAEWLFGFDVHEFPSALSPGAWYDSSFLSSRDVGAFAVTLVVVAVVYLFFRFTSLGLLMRAAALNPESARLVGVRVNLMLTLGWGFAALLGAIAGMIAAPIVVLNTDMMVGVLLYAFAGALVGGIDNPVGAVVGGVAVGLFESLIGAYVVGAELKLAVALVLIISVLIVRPFGLFGSPIAVRV
jgi:branched-chain amino acid transport system permease protein